MIDEHFRSWLVGRGLQDRPVSDALSRCKRVQEAFGSLDEHWARDRLNGILARLEYTAADRAASQPNRSGISIDGDVYNGLASLRSAVRRYAEFKAS